MINIRPYQAKDKENCRKICAETANGYDVSKESVRKLLCLLYNDYYTENEQSTCFVAVDDNDEAIGYVICAPNFKRFAKDYKPYLKQAARINFLHGVIGRLGLIVQRSYARHYSAHLHIDILDGYQRQGVGRRLIDALCARLKELNVNGVYLMMGAGNEKGKNFYNKYGFKLIGGLAGSMTFALKLSE